MGDSAEEDSNSKHEYGLKASTDVMDRLPKKIFYGELQEGKRS